MPTREAILNTLTEEREKLLARFQQFTPRELATPCTESEVPGGARWRPKDHLAHLTLVEKAFQGMVRRTLKGSADPVGFSRTGATNRDEIRAWIHRNNQTYIEAHHDDSMETLLADLANARKDTLTLLEQLTDEQLLLPISGALWADGSIGGVLMTNAQHENQHLGWIEEGLRS